MSEEAEVSARATQVASLLQRKDKAGALAASLKNPPVNSKEDAVKVGSYLPIFQLMMCILGGQHGNY